LEEGEERREGGREGESWPERSYVLAFTGKNRRREGGREGMKRVEMVLKSVSVSCSHTLVIVHRAHSSLPPSLPPSLLPSLQPCSSSTPVAAKFLSPCWRQCYGLQVRRAGGREGGNSD